jgi:urease accessory protein
MAGSGRPALAAGQGSMRRAALRAAVPWVVLGGAVAPAPAHAHLVSVRFGEFYSGMLHPVTALEHALAFLALGLLFGLQERRRAAVATLAFPVALVAGTSLAIALRADPLLGLVNTASFALAGGMVALARPIGTPWLVGLSVLFGLSHGFENGTAFVPGGNALLFVLGVAASGYLCVTLLSGAVHAVRERAWVLIGFRTVGSWVGAIGLMMLGLAAAGV